MHDDCNNSSVLEALEAALFEYQGPSKQHAQDALKLLLTRDYDAFVKLVKSESVLREKSYRQSALRQLFTEYRRRYFHNNTNRGASASIELALRRYAGSAWRFDKRDSECPYPRDHINWLHWQILKFLPDGFAADTIRKDYL